MNYLSYDFGIFRLFPESERLFAGPVEVTLGHRAARVLALLLERRGDLAKHQELISYAWPESVVADNNLRVQITAIRKVLREHDPQAASYIKSISGRGYRFIVEPQTESNAVAYATSKAVARQDSAGPPAAAQASTMRTQPKGRPNTFGHRTALGMSTVREGHIGQARRGLTHGGEARETGKRLRANGTSERAVRPVSRS